jgi:hypothetical protein
VFTRKDPRPGFHFAALQIFVSRSGPTARSRPSTRFPTPERCACRQIHFSAPFCRRFFFRLAFQVCSDLPAVSAAAKSFSVLVVHRWVRTSSVIARQGAAQVESYCRVCFLPIDYASVWACLATPEMLPDQLSLSGSVGFVCHRSKSCRLGLLLVHEQVSVFVFLLVSHPPQICSACVFRFFSWVVFCGCWG